MRKVDFSDGLVTQDIVRTALPMLLAQVLSLLYSIVDRIYIGRIPGEGTAALGAVGLCFPVIMIVSAFTNMYGMGGSPLFAMELGRGNNGKAGQIMNTAYRLLIMTAVVITAAGLLLGGPILRLFGASEETLPTSLAYLRIYLLGTLPLMISTGMNSYINAQGYATTGMLAVAIGAVANMVLDPLFIFVLEMGVRGAAIATVLSQILSLLFVLHFLKSSRNEHPVSFPVNQLFEALRTKLFPFVGRQSGKAAVHIDEPGIGQDTWQKNTTLPTHHLPEACQPDAQSAAARTDTQTSAGDGLTAGPFLPYAGSIISLGTAPFIMQVTNSLVTISCNYVLMDVGGALFVSVMTIISSVRSILDVPVLAISEGASPIISFNYGAGKRQHVIKAIKVLMAFAFPYTLLVWALILTAPGMFIRIFSADPLLMADASRGLRLYFSAFIFQAFQYCGQTVFKALGKKKHAIFFSLLRKAVLVVPLTFLLPYVGGLGTDGVFLAEPVSNVLGGLACFTTMVLALRADPFGK